MEARRYGSAPYGVVVVHGGPGAGGEMAPVARALATDRGVLEPIQTAASVDGQVGELREIVAGEGSPPCALIGYSWGAWLCVIAAARHPELARKLILVGSGPFEERYVPQMTARRLERLGESRRSELETLLRGVSSGSGADNDDALRRLGALASETDSFDPVLDSSHSSDLYPPRADIFREVWKGAAEMRRSGALLALAAVVKCPVTAIHGEHDPHPADGVREPLARVVGPFTFVLLRECGHTPWLERRARGAFYEILREELQTA